MGREGSVSRLFSFLFAAFHILRNGFSIFQHDSLPDSLAIAVIISAHDLSSPAHATIGIGESLGLVGFIRALGSLSHAALIFLPETSSDFRTQIISAHTAGHSTQYTASSSPTQVAAKIAAANGTGNAAHQAAGTPRFGRLAG
jgi:hypothetical protein